MSGIQYSRLNLRVSAAINAELACKYLDIHEYRVRVYHTAIRLVAMPVSEYSYRTTALHDRSAHQLA